MSGLTSRQRTVFVAVGVVVALLAAWFFVISPKRAEASRLEVEVLAAQDRVVAAQLQERTSREQHARLSPLPALIRAMPDRLEMARILRELNRLGGLSGVEFQSITPLPLKAEQGFQVLPLTVVFEGNFVRIRSFLERLREGVRLRQGKVRVDGRLFVVESLQLAEGERKLPFLTATMTLDAFVYGSPAPATVTP